uniref:PPM-type phosphatase domain-containing protein n=1 Tax=Romanomermis culicivorax TaxID=13658 RepID=A0A915L2X1_ROMCU
DVFHHLLKAFHAGHHLIVQEGGSLTTLCVVVVCPLKDVVDQWVACACNVGDSLAFVYNPNSGVREITLGSHDIQQMRDMRDAGGALGPVDGVNPELHNMTCSMTVVEPGDIIFLTSDGVSDNFDPVVGKFCLIDQKELNGANVRRAATARSEKTESVVDRETISTKTDNGPKQRSESIALPPNGMFFSPTDNQPKGLPVVEAYQRHELMLLRLEDMLRNGITLGDPAVTSAQQLCETLINFVIQLTTAKRKTLEDPDLYKNESHLFDHHSSAAVVRAEQKKRRQMVRQKISEMPGKLDHASVVAYRVTSSSLSPVSKNDEKNVPNSIDIGKAMTSPATYLTNEDRFNFVKDNRFEKQIYSQIVIHQSGSDEEPDESWLLTLFYDNSEWAAGRKNGNIQQPKRNVQNGAVTHTPLSPTVASESRRSFSKPPMPPPPVTRKASSKNVSGGDGSVEIAKNVEPIHKLTRNASESLTCPTIMENAADNNLIERNSFSKPRFRKLSKTIEKIVDGVRRPKKHGRGSPQRHTLAVDRSDLPSMNRNGVDDDFRSSENRHQRSSFASTSGGATTHCCTLPQTSLTTTAATVDSLLAPSPTPSKRFLGLKNNRQTWSPLRSLKFLKNVSTHRGVKNDQATTRTPDDENLVTICDKFEIEDQTSALSSPSVEHEAVFVRKSSSSSQVSFTANDSQFLATKFYLESLV